MLKPFIGYFDFEIGQINEIQGDVRISQVKVEYHDQAWDEELGMFVPTISLSDKVKVVIYSTETGSKISFYKSDNSDGERHTRYESVTQGTDDDLNEIWVVQDGSYGRDCDGSYSRHFEGVSDGSADPNYHNKWFPTMSDISVVKEASHEQRDYAAEAAGY